jgi:hypothetical protein
MSTKKKTTPKSPEPKYKLSQRLYTIIFHKGRPEEIWEVKVLSRKSYEEMMVTPTGHNIGKSILFSYILLTPDSGHKEIYEELLYPSFQQAANKFAEAFLVQRPL